MGLFTFPFIIIAFYFVYEIFFNKKKYLKENSRKFFYYLNKTISGCVTLFILFLYSMVVSLSNGNAYDVIASGTGGLFCVFLVGILGINLIIHNLLTCIIASNNNDVLNDMSLNNSQDINHEIQRQKITPFMICLRNMGLVLLYLLLAFVGGGIVSSILGIDLEKQSAAVGGNIMIAMFFILVGSFIWKNRFYYTKDNNG